ncbi:MAG: hypothetical protein LBB16_00785 [Puniceicoccales bacterium]|nr:hypothetical protein [Puniceicoccales bacterium]
MEIIFAITLLAIIAPVLFGIFFANADLSQNLIARTTMREVANDIKSFVMLANYDSIYDLAKNQEIIVIDEIEEDGIVTRKFTKHELRKDRTTPKFVARFELIGINKIVPTDVTETCVIPLKCEIYHLKPTNQMRPDKKFAETFDWQHTMFIAKNR